MLRQNDFIDLSGLERMGRDVRRDILVTFILPSGAGWGVVCVTTKYKYLLYWTGIGGEGMRYDNMFIFMFPAGLGERSVRCANMDLFLLPAGWVVKTEGRRDNMFSFIPPCGTLPVGVCDTI